MQANSVSSDLQHRGRADSWEWQCQTRRARSIGNSLSKANLKVFLFGHSWNLSTLDSCLKSHYSPGRAHLDGMLELISEKCNCVFQTILGAIATGTCCICLDYFWVVYKHSKLRFSHSHVRNHHTYSIFILAGEQIINRANSHFHSNTHTSSKLTCCSHRLHATYAQILLVTTQCTCNKLSLRSILRFKYISNTAYQGRVAITGARHPCTSPATLQKCFS